MTPDTLRGDDLKRMYEARFAGRFVYRDKVWQALIEHYFSRFVPSDAVVLDLGAGFGEFINNVSCKKKYAMDLNPDTRQSVAPDVEVFTQDCSEPWPLPDGSLDVLFTSNFFEHLPTKELLARTIREARRCLKPGGRLIAMGPNIKYVPGAYWDFWDHYLPLTELSLAEGLTQEGFVIEERLDKFMPFTMADGPQYPIFFVSAYLKLPLAWRIFGKQFLVVGRKDA